MTQPLTQPSSQPRPVLRLRLAAFALIGAGFAATAAALLTPGEFARAEIERQLGELSGATAQVEGRVTLALLPYPRLKAERVVVGDPQRPILATDMIRAEIRPLPLLAGRVELVEWSITDGDIRLEQRADGGWGWPGLARILGADGPDVATRTPRVSRIILKNCVVRLRAVDGRERQLDAVDAVARWTRPGDPLELSASGRMRGESFTWRSVGPAPLDIARGVASPMEASLTAGLARLAFVGRAASVTTPRAEGTLTIEAPSLRALSQMAGVHLPGVGVSGAVEARGVAVIGARSLSLSAATIRVEDSTFTGGVALRETEDGRPHLSGTLAGEEITLTPLGDAMESARAAGGGWSDAPFDASALRAVDLDLRLSAGRARHGGVAIERLAASAILAGGRLDLNLSSAAIWKGQIKARLTVAAAPAGVEVKAQANLERIDLGLAALELGATRRLAGVGSIAVTLEGAGPSPLALAMTSEGRIALSARQGEIAGVNLAELLRRFERAPLAIAGDWRGGRTPFDEAAFAGRLASGHVEIGEARLHGPGYRVDWTGRIDMIDNTLSLRGALRRREQAAGREMGQTAEGLPFDVFGSWSSPRFSPDPQALIRRSGAAAPFFQGVSDR